MSETMQYQEHRQDEQIEKLRRDAVRILRAVWKRIDWDSIDGNRRRTFQDEFASKVKSATHTNNLQRFIDNLCRKLGIRSLKDTSVTEVVNKTDHYEMLTLLREETLFLILMMRQEGDMNA